MIFELFFIIISVTGDDLFIFLSFISKKKNQCKLINISLLEDLQKILSYAYFLIQKKMSKKDTYLI